MIQLKCPHHGLYTITNAEANKFCNVLGPRACLMKRYSNEWAQFIDCNEEVHVLIDGQKIINSQQLIDYLKEAN